MDQNFKKKIDDLFKIKYEKITKSKFDELYCTLYADLNKISDPNKKESTYKRLMLTTKQTKQRWVKKIKSHKNLKINQDIENAKYIYNQVLDKTIEPEKFIIMFEANSIDEYINKLYRNMDLWVNSADALLSDFEYLTILHKKSIVSAFKNDIIKLYYSYTMSNHKEITRIPRVLSNIPFDPTNKKDYFTVEEKRELDDIDNFSLDGTIDKLISSNSNELIMKLEKRTYLRIEEGKQTQDLITQIAFLKAAKALNNLDLKIISLFYTNFYNLVTDKSIGKYISDLVKELGLSENKNNFIAVEKSLNKIGSIRLESPAYEGRKLKGSILDVFFDVKDGRKHVEVYLGGFLKNLILMDSSLNFNKDVFDKLSADSQQIAIWLQNRRLKLSITNPELKETISLNEFADAILMTAKNVYRRRDRIIEALIELQNYNLIIENFEYEKKEYQFLIKYIKLPENIMKRIETEDFKAGELIEGINYSVSN